MWQFVYPLLMVIIGLGLVSLSVNQSFPQADISTEVFDPVNRVYYANGIGVSTPRKLQQCSCWEFDTFSFGLSVPIVIISNWSNCHLWQQSVGRQQSWCVCQYDD